MSVFELINLGATLEPLAQLRMPELSDDGLDPKDFLSQSVDVVAEETITSEHDELTPTLLMLEALVELNLRALLLAETLEFDDDHVLHESLRNVQDSYTQATAALRSRLRSHKSELLAGNDVSALRLAIGRDMENLLQINYDLHDLYGREVTSTEQLVQRFERWDRRRSHILKRIKNIRSDKNRHGVKLGSLLQKQRSMDDEIQQLETRIGELRATRANVNEEIRRTTSVLESKSARYVAVFRDMESKGRVAIETYLTLNGVPETETALLLREDPVDTTFVGLATKQAGEKLVGQQRGKSPRSPTESTRTATPDKRTLGPSYPNDQGSLSRPGTALPNSLPDSAGHSTMGFRAHETDTESGNKSKARITESELSTPGNMSARAYEPASFDPAPFLDSNQGPYEQGYTQAAEQFETVKRSVGKFLHHVFAQHTEPRVRLQSQLNDATNAITKKIDLGPMLEFLHHKAAAGRSLEFRLLQQAAQLHEQAVLWRDTETFLAVQDSQLLETISSEQPQADRLVEILRATFQRLQDSNMHLSKADSNYCALAIHLELTAVAAALDQLGPLAYRTQVALPSNLILETRIPLHNLLMRITANGFYPTAKLAPASKLPVLVEQSAKRIETKKRK